jgi:hypothetical protein
MRALRGMIGTLGELFELLWVRRLWWLIPMVVVMLLFVVLIVLGTAPGVGPFIYALF